MPIATIPGGQRRDQPGGALSPRQGRKPAKSGATRGPAGDEKAYNQGMLRQMRRWEAIVLALSMAAMLGWWAGRHWSDARTGFIVVTTTPADATVLVDNVKVGDSSPVTIERRRGPYTVSVQRDGYSRSDQVVDVTPGRAATLNVKLSGSPDTGFQLTSEPPGALVWLDGTAIRESGGGHARTDFRAIRIPPGHHVLVLRDDRFRVWIQDIEVHPGVILKIHAVLMPYEPLHDRYRAPRLKVSW
jgi:hypothetical protein